jgi:hypothetical protein
MLDRPTYTVLVTPANDGHAFELTVPSLGNTETVALDLLEGEVLIRQAIALALDTDDTDSFDVDLQEPQPGT